MEIIEIIRAIFGFVLILFIPGFSATYALFPQGSKEIDAIERVALSIGLSIALVTLSVFALNFFLKVPINLMNSLLVVLGLTLIFGVIGYLKKGERRGEREKLKRNLKSNLKKKLFPTTNSSL
jgi:uncharacterized membrane protein